MRKRLAVLATVLLIAAAVLQPAVQAKGRAAPPAPVPMDVAAGGGSSGDVSIMGSIGGSYTGYVGDIYVGATPPNVSYTKPVLVFVHGYNSSAATWWTDTAYHGVNDMYQYAYNNGYRTAFVNLAPDQDMWYNGDLLTSQISQIRSYFGVSKVTVIAHSKGGVDANAASVHYGAAPSISRIVTLSSPHWGTPLADMAFSSWTWWLGELFGAANNATYVLQTGYMEYFRSITPQDTIPYYTFSGYKCGPVFSAMWYGCMAISGEDDGVVPVWSARIPGGVHLKEGYWDHDEIKMGSRTWSYFAPYILTASADSAAVAGVGPQLAAVGALPAGAAGAAVPAAAAAADRQEAPGNVILRGGVTDGAAVPGFPLESGVRSALFTVYSSSPTLTATLTGPDGAAYAVKTEQPVPAGDVFAGSWLGTVEVNAPAAGAWNLTTAAPESSGFLLVAAVDSDLKATLTLGQKVVAPGAQQALTVGFAPGRAIASSVARAEVGPKGTPELERGRPAFTAEGAGHRAVMRVPDGNAIHNVTAIVTGTLADGSAFERALVSSFAAVAPADRGTWK